MSSPDVRHPRVSLVATVMSSPDILSQVMTHLGLRKLYQVEAVSAAWREAAVAERRTRCVFRFEVTLGRGKGSAGGEFDLPFFVCSLPSRDCVLVSDFFNHRLQTLSTAAGSSAHQVVVGKEEGVALSCPTGLVCDDAFCFVAESGSSCLQKLRLSDWSLILGTGRHGSAEGELRHPHGLALDAKRLFVADNDNHRICIFDHQLAFRASFGRQGCGQGELRDPCGLAVHRWQLFVADLGNHRLQIFTVRGRWLRSIGREGRAPGEFLGPWGVAVARLAQGVVLCVSESRARRVQVLGLDGTPLQVLAPPGAGSLAGLCVEHHGSGAETRARRLFVADYEHHSLLVLSVRSEARRASRVGVPLL